MIKFTIIIIALTTSLTAQHELWYQQPAKDWNQAVPVGNGRLGAMVFGSPDKERIQLNEDSVWAGPGETMVDAKGTPADLQQIRQMIDDGKLAEADKFIIQKFSRNSIVRSHQTLGDLHIHWQETQKPATHYRRSLNLKSAIASSTWKRGDTSYTQEVFCSYADETLFVKLTAQGSATLSFDLLLDRPKDKGVQTHKTTAHPSGIMEMSGQVTQRDGVVDGKKLPDMKGVKFHTRLKVSTAGGSIKATNGTLQIRGAKEAYVRLTATTDFWSPEKRAKHMSGTGKEFIKKTDNHPVGKLEEKDIVSGALPHALARANHIADHQALYNRSILTIPTNSSQNKLPTDKRLAALKPDQPDPGLEALIYHYGRYLLITSSRDNGNPANLQGLWNPHIKAPWNSDYHLNINLQMNYWPAEVTNLSETHTPVFTWMQALAKRGAITAKEQYGMRGWMSHHASELRAPATMKSARAQWGGWIHGGGWMCQHIWTHYAYTQDKKFLKETGYPLLAGQARFYLDWLVEKDGKLISTPESSPENGFKTDSGRFSAVCAKAAMGQQIITEVLTNTLSAADVLGIANEFTAEVKTTLAKIDNGLHIGADGRLLEWDKPYKETQLGHRHLSHLYAFHPGISVTHEKTPKILEAVKKSISLREKHGSVGIGWSRAWAVSIYARLRDGNTAHHHLHEMLRSQTLMNGFNSVFGKGRPVFQIEANLGATAGVAEMLLQSHGGQLHILPALPEAWSSGSITGLKARGGHTIDITWKNGALTNAVITKGTGSIPQILIQGLPIPAKDPRIKID